MGNREGTILQFVEKEKRLKKGVDIWFAVWYYNKAVARESEKQEKMQWIGSGSNPTTQGMRAFVMKLLRKISEKVLHFVTVGCILVTTSYRKKGLQDGCFRNRTVAGQFFCGI